MVEMPYNPIMKRQVNSGRIPLWRVLLSVLIPVGLMLFQAAFWDLFKPYAWFLAYPAIMIAPLIGGMAGGISASVITACMVYYFFLPPVFSFKLDLPYTFYVPLVLFVCASIGVNLITRRMRMLEMKAALRESETRFETLFEHAPIALCHADEHGKFLKINRYMESVSGYRFEEIPDSLTWFSKVYPDPEYRNHVTETWNTARDAAMKAGTRVEPQEYDIVTKSGEVKTMLFSATPLGRELLSFMVDITPIRKARESLAQYNLQLQKEVEMRTRDLEISRQELARRKTAYRILAENASDVVCRYTPEGYLDWASPSLAALLGWTPEELKGKYFLELVHPDDQESATAHYPEALSGNPVSFEVRLRAKSGEYRHVSAMVKLAGDGLNDMSLVTGLRDIHAEVLARNALKEKSTILDLAVQAADVGIWNWNFSDNSLTWDQKMIAWYDVPSEKAEYGLYYQTWYERLHPDDRERCVRSFGEAREMLKPYEDEFRLLLPDGSVQYMESKGVFLFNERNVPVGMVGINRDITPQKTSEHRLEELVHVRTLALAKSRDEAESANRAKSAFLATMSHEMRTPLNHIMGMTWLLKKEAAEEKARSRLEMVESASKQLLEMISDALEYSRLEAESIALKPVQFELESMCDLVLERNEPRAKAKGLTLTHGKDQAVPSRLSGDPDHIAKVLDILVGNAIKFSEHETVNIHATLAESNHSTATLRFEVKDEGIGISAERQTTLFTAYSQADSSTTRKFGGTGLGLALARRIVALMCGEIGVTSEEGKGSTFWFTVKLGVGGTDAHPD